MKKPRITKPHLVWKRDRKGAWVPQYVRRWSEGGKRKSRVITLKWGGDPERLDALYWQAHAGKHEAQQAPAKYTWRELVTLWEKDPRVQGRLAESTKVSYHRVMAQILEKNADKDMRRTTRKGLRAVHDKLSATPRKADKFLATVSLLWNYAVKKQDWPLGENPASGIDLYGKQREFLPWPDWMVAKLPDAPVKVRTAAELILGTGQRPSAAIGMRYDQFDGEWMTVEDQKAGEFFEAYCPTDLRDQIARMERKGEYVLAKNLREPLGYDAIEKEFRAWRDSLGAKAKPYSLHGLRKLAIVRLAEAGCSDAEIQAVTNQSAETVAYYRSKASRKKLSRRAQERRR